MSKTEILPSPAYMLKVANDHDPAELEKLIQQKVAEALMVHGEFTAFEPFFRSRRIGYEMRRLQTVSEHKKWGVRFLRYGCLHCGSTDRIHGGCGCCDRCYQRVFSENTAIIREMMGEENPRVSEPSRPTPVVPREVPVDAGRKRDTGPRDYSAMGTKGGSTTMARLTPEQRREGAKRAINARWDKPGAHERASARRMELMTPEERSESARKAVTARLAKAKTPSLSGDEK